MREYTVNYSVISNNDDDEINDYLTVRDYNPNGASSQAMTILRGLYRYSNIFIIEVF